MVDRIDIATAALQERIVLFYQPGQIGKSDRLAVSQLTAISPHVFQAFRQLTAKLMATHNLTSAR